MNFNVKATKNTVTVTSKALAEDNYKKYLDKFIAEFLPIIKNDTDVLAGIIKEQAGAKSWRLLNREVRKACDQYCSDKKIMNHAEYQDKFFYEGVMIGRLSHGANAEWVSGKASKVVKTEKEKATKPVKEVKPSTKKTVETKEVEEAPKVVRPTTKSKGQGYGDDEWSRINKPIADRIAQYEKDGD